jgi:hypothetical protein
LRGDFVIYAEFNNSMFFSSSFSDQRIYLACFDSRASKNSNFISLFMSLIIAIALTSFLVIFSLTGFISSHANKKLGKLLLLIELKDLITVSEFLFANWKSKVNSNPVSPFEMKSGVKMICFSSK